MNRTYLKHLTASETELLLLAEPKRLAELDEDELGDLHQRMRRASRKYRTLHRRQAAAQVADDRSRGKASAKNERTAVKAEAFEVALAQVSAALGKAARASAREIKAERLAMAAGSHKETASRSAAPRHRPGAKGHDRRARGTAGSTRTPASTKRKASSQAQGARRQAKRDAR